MPGALLRIRSRDTAFPSRYGPINAPIDAAQRKAVARAQRSRLSTRVIAVLQRDFY
jgi:hypothetical protein